VKVETTCSASRAYRARWAHPTSAPVIALVIAGAIVLGLPGSTEAQVQTPDSTAALLRALHQRLDSLERVITELRSTRADTTETADELAALRAAAQAAAGPGETGTERTPAGSRTRSLQILNPEISVTGDVVGTFVSPDGESGSFSGVPREFEFSFQAALDPYTRTKIFVTRHEDFEIAGAPEHGHAEEEGDEGEEDGHTEEGLGFEIEEGYMYWVGLPGGFGAKVGKFRQEIGLYNRWHTHALLEVEQPLAMSVFLGEDGLAQTGVAVTFPSFTVGPATQTLTFEVTRGDNPVLFEEGSQLSYLGRFQNFWDLGASTYIQLGATGVYGKNPDLELESRLLGLDVSFRWTPSGQSLYRDFQLKGEWYFVDQDEGVESRAGDGGYVQANYRLNRRWIVGARADYVNSLDDDPNLVQVVPSLTWWQSEWVRIRLQYNMLRPEAGSPNHTALLQFVWAMGPHKHESY